MMAFLDRPFGGLLPLAFAAALVAACGGISTGASAADITVVLDRARLVKLPDRVATVVIGNPVIADAAVQSGGTMIVTGKGYGTTNVIALDRGGVVLMERTVEVIAPGNTVIVYRGTARETYACAPDCEPRLMLGDSVPYFQANAAQIGARNTLAHTVSPTR
jgi:hypothetical protein